MSGLSHCHKYKRISHTDILSTEILWTYPSELVPLSTDVSFFCYALLHRGGETCTSLCSQLSETNKQATKQNYMTARWCLKLWGTHRFSQGQISASDQ